MQTNAIPILLTSSVIPHDTGVALTDSQERTRLALESVKEWLKIEPTLRIVLCDGSGFDFSSLIAKNFPLASIECLHFDNNASLVKQYGRGYGEGEIVRHALVNSKSISEAGCFVKCTSKLWVENYLECLEHWNGNLLFKGVFLNAFSLFKPTEFAYIDTRFYIANCDSYRQFFESAHAQINKDLGHGLEECFRDVILKNKIEKILFRIPPVICGVGGGTGTYYKNTSIRKLKEKLRLKIVSAQRKFRHLFSCD